MDWNDVKAGKMPKAPPSVWDSVKDNSIPVTAGLVFDDEDMELPKPYEVQLGNNVFPEGTIPFDLETWSADEIWHTTNPDFIRLIGYSVDDGPVINEWDTEGLIELIEGSNGWIIGHNIMNFDLIALQKFRGVSILRLAENDRCIDTKILAFLADPPLSRTESGAIEKEYSLQNTGIKYLGEGKMVDVITGGSVLKELAKEFGGYDKIPKDNVRYNEYLKRDVEATRDLAKVLPMSDYTRREHRIAAVAATISLNGFRVDIPLLEERIAEGELKRETILGSLSSLGMPSPDETKAPHRTKVGLAAIEQAFTDLGVTLERTATGRPAMGKPVLEALSERFNGEGPVADLAEAIMGLNGIRTIYGNIQDNLVGDRVHPNINMRQSSGRWSITEPGITVIGKRGGKVREREVFLPDEGCVLISVDLAQVDARCVAGLSQDYNYIRAFDPGRDVHTENAIELFGGAEHRERAKASSHGVNYGMQAKKLAWTTGMDFHEADAFIYGFYKKFPRLQEWQDEVRETGSATGVLSNGFGRLMKIEPDRSFTQSPALMGQSTARDILMEGVLNLWKNGGEEAVNMIRAVIHDELVMSVPIDILGDVEKTVVDSLTFPWCPVGGTHEIQIEAGLNKRGINWADCYRKD